jgi:hypothetical protein
MRCTLEFQLLNGPTTETLDAVGARAHGNSNVTGTTVVAMVAIFALLSSQMRRSAGEKAGVNAPKALEV